MMEQLAVRIGIGAVLTGAFDTAVSSAPKRLGKIGDAVALLNRQGSQVKLLEKAEIDLEKSRAKLSAVNQELLRTKLAMRGADGKELKTLETRARDLARQQETLTKKVTAGRGAVERARTAYRDATHAVQKQDNSLKALGGTLDEIKRKEGQLQNAIAARVQAQEKFSQARGKLLGPLAMATGLGMALKSAGSFQSTLADIGITADLSRERMAAIGSTLGDLAFTTGQTREELAEGFNVMVTAGMDADLVEKVIGTVGLTATAAKAEIGDVAKTAFATMNNLKLAPDEMLQAMDMLVAAGKAGSFELDNMSQYFPAMTAAAGKLGMQGTKAVATIGASLQVAMYGAADPSQAATNMENYLNSLTSPDTVRKFRQAGIDLEREFKGWQENGLDPIEESLKLIQSNTGGDPFRIGELFGNKRVLSFINPMLRNMAEYQTIRAEIAAAEGMVSEDARRRMQEDPSFAFKTMGGALVQLRDAAITPLLAPMGNVFASIINIIQPVKKWMEANTELVGKIGKLVVALIGGKLVFSTVAVGVGLMRWQMAQWRVVMLLTRGTAMSLLTTTRTLGGALIGRLTTGLRTASMAAMGLGRSLLLGARSAMVSAGSAAMGLGRVLGGALLTGLQVVGKAVLFIGRALLMNPIGLAITVIAGGAYLIYKYWEPISGFFKKLWAGTNAIFSRAWDDLKTAFSGGIAGVSKLILDWSPLGLFYKAFAGVMGWFGVSLPDSFSAFGARLMDGLVGGIAGAFGKVRDAVSGLGKQVAGWFKSALGIQSPSRVFMGLGQMVGEGAAIGIGGMARRVGAASAALGTAATLAFAPDLALLAAQTPVLPPAAPPVLPPVAAPVLERSIVAAPVPASPFPLPLDVCVLAPPVLPPFPSPRALTWPRLPAPAAAPPLPAVSAVPAPAPAAVAPPSGVNAPAPAAPVHYTFNITQQSGESGQALAQRVMDLAHRKAQRDRRAGLGDWA